MFDDDGGVGVAGFAQQVADAVEVAADPDDGATGVGLISARSTSQDEERRQ